MPLQNNNTAVNSGNFWYRDLGYLIYGTVL